MKSVFVFALLVLGSRDLIAQNAAAPTPPPACADAAHRQFDFWVGSWDVYPTGKEKLVAHSVIEKLYAGCAIRENWMPLSGPGGGSLSNYVADDKVWRQTWLDSQGSRVEFKGGMQGNSMVLTGFWKGVVGPGKDGTVRMTYTRDPSGVVRQFGEVSTDGGKTWAPSFDFTYKPSTDIKQ